MKTANEFLCDALRVTPIPGRWLDTALKISRLTDFAITKPALVSDRWNSFQILVDNLEDPIGRQIYYQGYFEWRETQFVRKCLTNGDTVLDIGANIGWYTLLSASLVKENGRVFAFEPMPESRGQLIKNCALNKLENVKIFDFAVGRESGQASIFSASPKHIGGASLFPANANGMQSHVIQVRTLDEVIEEHEIRRVRLCKMDIEGSEIDALDGMKQALKKRTFDFILVEVNAVALKRAGHDPAELASRIRDAGYRIADVRAPRRELESTDLPAFGNLICAHQQ
jgi:FkbM family methyltransferase